MSSFTKTSQDMNLARQIFLKATNSVLPQIRLRQILQFDGNNLHIENRSYQIPKNGCHVVGFGKAVIGMAAELQRILGSENIQKIVLSVPKGICDTMVASGRVKRKMEIFFKTKFYIKAEFYIPKILVNKII